MLGGVARPWRGKEVERATLRVSCRADVLGGPPWWLMAFGKQLATLGTWFVPEDPPQAVTMVWVWASAWGSGGDWGELADLHRGKTTRAILCLWPEL